MRRVAVYLETEHSSCSQHREAVLLVWSLLENWAMAFELFGKEWYVIIYRSHLTVTFRGLQQRKLFSERTSCAILNEKQLLFKRKKRQKKKRKKVEHRLGREKMKKGNRKYSVERF